jgi:hypothetical protein
MLKKNKRGEPNKRMDDLSPQGEQEHQQLKQAEQEYLQRLAGSININPPAKSRINATPQPLPSAATPQPGSPPYPRPLHSPKPVPSVQGDFEVEVESPGRHGNSGFPPAGSAPQPNPAVVNRLIRSYTPPPQPTPPAETITPSPLPPGAATPLTQAPPQATPSPAPTAPPQEAEGTFPIGTIIRLEDGTVGIYKDPVRGKEYEIVYCLRPSGRVSPEGIALFAYNAQRIGMLPKNVLDRMQRTMRWDRDTIVYHLDSFEFCSLVPYPGAAGENATHDYTPLPLLTEKQTETASHGTGHTPLPVSALNPAGAAGATGATPSPATGILIRGRRLRISFGQGKSWDAVFWGRDDLDYIVAHRTHNSWGLMHLDLARFKDSTEAGDILSPQEIQTIEHEIVQTQSNESPR